MLTLLAPLLGYLAGRASSGGGDILSPNLQVAPRVEPDVRLQLGPEDADLSLGTDVSVLSIGVVALAAGATVYLTARLVKGLL